MDKSVERVIKDIKSIKIQGARNIAKAAINALGVQARASKKNSSQLFYEELLLVGQKLALARPTEPMTRNYIDEFLRELKKGKNNFGKISEIRDLAVQMTNAIVKRMDENAEKLMSYGQKLLPNGATVVTHCHSSTVTGILKMAAKKGNSIKVFCCETRPLYQGRKTAKELVEFGIDTTLIVDSGVNGVMKRADICLVGADAITSRGDLINKVGTSTVAHIARFHDISFYSAAEVYKYSPLTLFGTREEIEQRNSKEVWDGAPKKLKILNPAFEAVAARYINGYITELGIVPPQSLFSVAAEKLGIDIV